MKSSAQKSPLTLAHMGGRAHGRENSIEAIVEAQKYSPDIIELDLRKSRDGVIFCHHGSMPFGLLRAQFLRFFNFKTIQKWLEVKTFAEILPHITPDKIVYCDLKQSNISAQDIMTTVGTFEFVEVWIACYWLNHLKKLRINLGGKYTYVYNTGFFFSRKKIRKIKTVGCRSLHLFPWQCSEEKRNYVRSLNMDYQLCPYMLSKKRYKQLVQKYNALTLQCDNLETLY